MAAAIDPPLNAEQDDFLDQRFLDCALSIARPMQASLLEYLPCDVLVVKETQFAECLPVYGT